MLEVVNTLDFNNLEQLLKEGKISQELYDELTQGKGED